MKKVVICLLLTLVAIHVGAQVNMSERCHTGELRINDGSKTGVIHKSQRRSVDNGFYYTIVPAPLFTGIKLNDDFELSYSYSDIIMPFNTEFTFVKSANAGDVQWLFTDDSNSTDVTAKADAKGNITYSFAKDKPMEPLKMTDGTMSFTFLEDGFYKLRHNMTPVITNDVLAYHIYIPSTFDGKYNNHSPINGQTKDSDGTPWIFGTGTVTFESGSYKTIGVSQRYPAPAAPLYVDQIYMSILSALETPIPDGEIVYMMIYDEVTKQNIVTLSATAADLVGKVDVTKYYGSMTGTGKCYEYKLLFSEKETATDGIQTLKPFILEHEYSIDIDHNGNNMHFGIPGFEIPGYLNMSPAESIVSLGASTTARGRWDYGNLAINLQFHSMYQQDESWPLGDIDHNGKVNTTDVTVLYNVIFGTDVTTDHNECNIDGSDDPNPNTSDVTALYNIIFGTAK